MARSALNLPTTDPTPIFEAFRGCHSTELLTAAVAEFDLFSRLDRQPMTHENLRGELQLEPRPAVVLLTALRAMDLLATDEAGRLTLTDLAREHLIPGGEFYVGDYLSLAAQSPAVQEMIARLRTNRPAGADDEEHGAAFIYRDGIESAMETEASARSLTLALAGRAKNVAPLMAECVAMDDARVLLDVGGGTGIYSIALVQKNPQLRAIVFDRPEVLKVAGEMATEYGVSDRIELIEGDMFTDALPQDVDVALLSNILHDWDVPQCRDLVRRCAETVRPGGQVLVHDVFLHDDHSGPLPIALYSASLFSLTEGRAYSAAEYRQWLVASGLQPGEIIPTLIHCGVLTGLKP
jgi:predicted O-methyltransferase YrrM